MPPKKKRSKSKSRPRPTQTQSQKVVVNIGGSSTKRKRRSGGSSMTPAAHAQNLVPFFIQAAQTQQPLVDYDRIAKMTGALQEQNVPNRTPALQSQVPASVMAVSAAEERRAGPTSGGFESTPSESRLDQEPISRPEPLSRSLSVPEMVEAIEAKQFAAVAQPAEAFEEGLIKKGMSIGRKVGEKNLQKKVSQARQMGAAEEQGRRSRQEQIDKQQREERVSMGMEEQRTKFQLRQSKIEGWNKQLARMTPAGTSVEQRNLLRGQIASQGLNITELNPKAQRRLVISRKPKRDLSGDSD